MLSYLNHQDVLALGVIEDAIFAGTGGTLLVYINEELSFTKQIFYGQQIHIITLGKTKCSNFIVIGGKEVAVCRLAYARVEVVHSWRCDDWVLDDVDIGSQQLVLVTAHNQAQLWDYQGGLLKGVSAPRDRCILYSSKLMWRGGKELIVLAGTVFSDVIIWKPDFDNLLSIPNILFRLTGHNGVIFSINIRETIPNEFVICTTSDDRSLRFWNVSGPWDSVKIDPPAPPLFGHTARVWRSLMLDDCVATIGEDSSVCLWNYNGDLRSKLTLHTSAGIRGLDFCHKTKKLITGGGDGGISATPWSLFDEFSTKAAVCLRPYFKEVPRKVIFSDYFGPVYLTDNGKLLYGENGQVLTSSNLFRQCTDLSTTSGGHIAVLCNRLGSVFLILEDAKLIELDINNGEPCQTLLLRGNYLLVQSVKSAIVLKKLCLIDGVYSFEEIRVFVLPKGKDLTPACFLYLPDDGGKLLLGDRLGGLHIYQESVAPVQSLKKLHSHLGISDIVVSSDAIWTTGAGGWIRKMKFHGDRLKIIHSSRIPLENGCKIMETLIGTLVLGFHSSFFQIWNLSSRSLIGSYNCGGGHRSISFRLRGQSLEFLFIKDKLANIVTFQLEVSNTLRNCFHAKVINSLKMVESTVFVSGGEDNMLRLCKFQNGDVETLYVGEQHISSIRALSVASISPSERLIVSAGGREQLVLSSYNTNTCELREVTSHLPENTSFACGRYMCLATDVLDDGSVLILVGCSDCTLRVFVYHIRTGLECKAKLVSNCCVLQVALLRHGAFRKLYAAGFGTIGEAVVWDISDVQEEPKILSIEEAYQNSFEPVKPNLNGVTEAFDRIRISSRSIDSKIKLHASGINSVALCEQEAGGYLLATGGDDNMLSLAVLERGPSEWSGTPVWSSSNFHSCQITGIILSECLVLTTAIDQRLIISELTHGPSGTMLTILREIVSTVPDIHGVTLLHYHDCLYPAVYGKGIEMLKMRPDDSTGCSPLKAQHVL